MRRRNRKGRYTLAILLLLVVGISIGYSALTSSLDITGTTTINKSSWDIHFDNLTTTSGGVVAEKEAQVDTTKTVIDYTITLSEPGDFYEFTVDIVNNGSIDAMIDEVLNTGLTEEQANYIDYTIKYESGISLGEKDNLKANSIRTAKVKVKYRDDIIANDLPTKNQTISLTFKVTYIQDDGTSIEPHACNITKGDGTKVGDEVTCGTESFYIISKTSDSIKMLSKYNLNIGTNQYQRSKSGIQNEFVKGISAGENTYGNISFSTTNYWQSATSYPQFVYDANSNLYEHVENYETYLKKELGVTSADTALITLEELQNMGCGTSTCTNSSYSWIYQTSYWLSTAINSSSIYIVDTTGTLAGVGYLNNDSYGVRPVVTISTNEL